MNLSQLKTMLWLRWRLSSNQWTRGGSLNQVIAGILLVLGVIASLGGTIAGFVLGTTALSAAAPQTLLLAWDGLFLGFLLVWSIGIATEIQRSETLDLGKMLHLPISLRQIFTINFIASHATLSLILTLPAMVGLAAGLAAGRGIEFLLLVPLVLASVFMVTAWTYCLRGWLVTLMVNQRRKRAILMGITVFVVLLAQLPNLYINITRSREQPILEEVEAESEDHLIESGKLPALFLSLHRYVPPLWLANGAQNLARGKMAPAIYGILGAMTLGSLGLLRAYQGTVRFYHGKLGSATKPSANRNRIRSNWLERPLRAFPPEVAAVALASARSMTRAPEVKMMLLAPVIMIAMIGSATSSRVLKHPIPEELLPLMATAAAALPLFGVVQLMFNQFGFDRGGFRGLVLMPTPRHYFLVGKNLAILPLVISAGAALLVTAWLIFDLALSDAFAGFFQLIAGFLLLAIGGNLVSVFAPYRIAQGSLKPTKTPLKTTVLFFVTNLLFPVLIVPILVPPLLDMLVRRAIGPTTLSVNLTTSILLAILALACYRLMLNRMGILLQRRERTILEIVTHEVE
jgi:ABC-2 type transport system permease protein